MALIALLGDVHIGARGGNPHLKKAQADFFIDTFWPLLIKHGIKEVIQLGDLFDDRKALRHDDIAFFNNYIATPAMKTDTTIHYLVGNHDIPHRNDLMNSAQDVVGINPINLIVTRDIHGRKVTFIPWICEDNYEEAMQTIKAGGDILIGHFGINEFEMTVGFKCNEGLSTEMFSNWKAVWSGHFHHQQEKLNIHYLGTPYQLTWADANTKHGFWVWDTETTKLSYVNNRQRLFHKLVWPYEDDAMPSVTNQWVRVDVKAKPDVKAFESFIEQLNRDHPAELKIIEQFEEYHSDAVTDMLELADTEKLIDEYIEDVATQDDKELIKNLMRDIYAEARTIE